MLAGACGPGRPVGMVGVILNWMGMPDSRRRQTFMALGLASRILKPGGVISRSHIQYTAVFPKLSIKTRALSQQTLYKPNCSARLSELDYPPIYPSLLSLPLSSITNHPLPASSLPRKIFTLPTVSLPPTQTPLSISTLALCPPSTAQESRAQRCTPKSSVAFLIFCPRL